MLQLDQLFHMQQSLDSHIEKKHQLEAENLFDRKVLALLVEIGELANETRCFKFWSVKPSSEKPIILEEFVDCLHFILSLGIECGFHQQVIDVQENTTALNVTEQFLLIFAKIHDFRNSKELKDYLSLFEVYLQLAVLLGFTNEDILQAYFSKNEVNYQRQESNY